MCTTFAALHSAYLTDTAARWTAPSVAVKVGRTTLAADAVAALPLGRLFGNLWDGSSMDNTVNDAMYRATRAAKAAGLKRDAVVPVTLDLTFAGKVTLFGRCTADGVVLSVA